MTSLALIRHGQSEWNLQNRFTGWVDVDLTDKGRAEAKKAGALLKATGVDFSAAYASVQKRAIHTLWIALELRGEFPPGAEDNFRALAASIAESDLGAALGARDALPTLRIESEEARIALRASLASEVLAAGLRTLFVAEMRELLSINPREPDAPPAPSLESSSESP